jgi:hypothetical protein
MNPIAWLVEQILEFDPTLYEVQVDHPDMSIAQWLALRIKWGIDKGFVFFETDEYDIPVKALCMRPVNERILEAIENDYVGNIWEYDPAGKIVFIDFRFGRGSIPFTWDLCRRSGRSEVAYHHHQQVKRVSLDKVPRVEELLHG